MKNILASLIVGLSFLIPSLHAEVDKQASADINAVAPAVSEAYRNNVVWFLIHGDSAKSGPKQIETMIAKGEINKIPRTGDAHDALVRLFGRLMANEKAALDSREYAYSRLRDFALKDSNAKKILEDTTKVVKTREADPLTPKLK